MLGCEAECHCDECVRTGAAKGPPRDWRTLYFAAVATERERCAGIVDRAGHADLADELRGPCAEDRRIAKTEAVSAAEQIRTAALAAVDESTAPYRTVVTAETMRRPCSESGAAHEVDPAKDATDTIQRALELAEGVERRRPCLGCGRRIYRDEEHDDPCDVAAAIDALRDDVLPVVLPGQEVPHE